MSAAGLPLELQQHIFSLLDCKSFYSARNVNRWWRFASCDVGTLRTQLKKLPARHGVDRRNSKPQELESLFNEAARTLMFGVRASRKEESRRSQDLSYKMQIRPEMTTNANGSKVVTIYDRTIALFDVSGAQSKLLAQRPLIGLKQSIGMGPWLKVAPPSHLELALSSDGNLLAVSQEREIQIYDLSVDPESQPVNEYVCNAAGHCICRLDFEQNDYTMRVRLSENGRVLYLGLPPTDDNTIKSATLDHWDSVNGLKHTFLDSSVLTLSPPTDPHHQPARVAGLQLLQPFHDGYLFAAQKHGGGQSSHYLLAYAKSTLCKSCKQACPLSIESGSVVELAKLESYLSSRDYAFDDLWDNGMGSWENMPSAHEHHPRFALSPNARLLVLAARDKKCVRPMAMARIFVYRLPSENMILTLVNDKHSKAVSQTAVPMEQSEHSIARIPLCLGTVQGEVADISMEHLNLNRRSEIRLGVVTQERSKAWCLETL